MSAIINVENISKSYSIGRKESYGSLRDEIMQVITSPFRKSSIEEKDNNTIWALKDVSFEVKEGDVLGIIGRNGAGKSTLLKILSRITEPTSGRITMKGRVASLLEVGTGFHPELTGRENILLNGALLGMTRPEIRSKFDEIVAFAEIDKFLDTPVKRYSSGMYVRLAFAVAAHLEPEILIIDEVLAVGDASFQKKCLGKMGDVAKGGRTVLFVSHNMAMIASLCTHCLLLERGEMIKRGVTGEIVDLYYSDNVLGKGEVDFTKTEQLPGDSRAKLMKARILNSRGEITSEVRIDEPAILEMEYQLLQDNLAATPNFHIYNSQGVCAFVTSDTPLDPLGKLKAKAGVYVARCHIPGNFLNDGTYYIGFALSPMHKVGVYFYETDLLLLSVIDPIDGTITRGMYAGPMPGTVRPALQWESRRIQ